MNDAPADPLQDLPPERPLEFRTDDALYVFLIGPGVARVEENYRVAWEAESRAGDTVWRLSEPELAKAPTLRGKGPLGMTLRELLTEYVMNFQGDRIADAQQKLLWRTARDFIGREQRGGRSLREPGVQDQRQDIVYTLTPLSGMDKPKPITSLDEQVGENCWLTKLVPSNLGHPPSDDEVAMWMYGFRLVYSEHQAGGLIIGPLGGEEIARLSEHYTK
ncbi:hypothetical protein J4439_00330 [Candidatus Woesearchaeota archaeon]|nr:hypothetical protein [Candidatus Woesearchaeota archaeon]